MLETVAALTMTVFVSQAAVLGVMGEAMMGTVARSAEVASVKIRCMPEVIQGYGYSPSMSVWCFC